MSRKDYSQASIDEKVIPIRLDLKDFMAEEEGREFHIYLNNQLPAVQSKPDEVGKLWILNGLLLAIVMLLALH
ncbi:MAG: hypothetical protein KDI30_04840 [Pseudomonadales bacterium]|nr:hypothetical protein [Pseudomonadales bacterium]